MISETFIDAVWRYRARGGRLYKLAMDHGMSPSVLRATTSGVRRGDDDPRLIAIGAQLGLRPDEVFAREEVAS